MLNKRRFLMGCLVFSLITGISMDSNNVFASEGSSKPSIRKIKTQNENSNTGEKNLNDEEVKSILKSYLNALNSGDISGFKELSSLNSELQYKIKQNVEIFDGYHRNKLKENYMILDSLGETLEKNSNEINGYYTFINNKPYDGDNKLNLKVILDEASGSIKDIILQCDAVFKDASGNIVEPAYTNFEMSPYIRYVWDTKDVKSVDIPYFGATYTLRDDWKNIGYITREGLGVYLTSKTLQDRIGKGKHFLSLRGFTFIKSDSNEYPEGNPITTYLKGKGFFIANFKRSDAPGAELKDDKEALNEMNLISKDNVGAYNIPYFTFIDKDIVLESNYGGNGYGTNLSSGGNNSNNVNNNNNVNSTNNLNNNNNSNIVNENTEIKVTTNVDEELRQKVVNTIIKNDKAYAIFSQNGSYDGALVNIKKGSQMESKWINELSNHRSKGSTYTYVDDRDIVVKMISSELGYAEYTSVLKGDTTGNTYENRCYAEFILENGKVIFNKEYEDYSEVPEYLKGDGEKPFNTTNNENVENNKNTENKEQNTNLSNIDINSLNDMGFSFTSGAGAWGTGIKFSSNGKFEGGFHDSNMGVNEVNVCSFNGTFKITQRIDDFTYKMELTSLTISSPTGKVEPLDNGMNRKYVDTPYGFEESKNFTLHLPGKDISSIKEKYKPGLFTSDPNILDFYLITNEDKGYAIRGREN